MLRARIRILLSLLLALGGGVGAMAQAPLKRYETKYYVIWSDLEPEKVREAAQRVTQMAEEYAARTKGFAGSIQERLPFYLYRRAADYVAAGGPAGSAGVFMGDRLMAIAGPEAAGYTWHIVQHEGFHQFVHSVIKGDIPIWANEGLAEYFGEALWTGDEFVSGIVPPQRLARLKQSIAGGQMKSLESMMLLPQAVWNAQLSGANYDQAWSMVHFLAHADNGKYQKPFNNFLREVSNGAAWPEAWKRNFGSNVEAFEGRWRDYWLNMAADESRLLYARAAVATLTGFLGRAYAERQPFMAWDAFVEAAKGANLKTKAEDALPRDLLTGALQWAAGNGTWSIEKKSGGNWIVCELEDGTRLTGSFKLRGSRIGDVTVKVAGSKPAKADGADGRPGNPAAGKPGKSKD